MRLAEYLRARRVTAPALARTLGVPHQDVYRWRDGTTPRPEMMHRIVAATGGEVTVLDLLPPPTLGRHKKQRRRA